MKHLILPLIFLLFSFSLQSQDLEGTWSWVSPDNGNTFELELEQNGSNLLRGKHCAVFYNGIKRDCTTEGENRFSVNVMMLRKNIFGGTIESGHSFSRGKIRMVYNRKEDILTFTLTEKPKDEFYLPKEAILRRVQ